jgi:nitrile hydratase
MSYQSFADLGGLTGMGAVQLEPNEPAFHGNWEATAFALTVAMGATGCWNIDMSRRSRETLPGYLTLSYYQIWINGLCKLLTEQGLVTDEEIRAGQMLRPALPVNRVLTAAAVAGVLAKGAPTDRVAASQARFSVGDGVRTRQAPADHHTRLPAYARGKAGRIAAVREVHVYPDSNSQGSGEQPQWLYSVAIEGTALWGQEAEPGLTVYIDAWEPYLERVQ